MLFETRSPNHSIAMLSVCNGRQRQQSIGHKCYAALVGKYYLLRDDNAVDIGLMLASYVDEFSLAKRNLSLRAQTQNLLYFISNSSLAPLRLNYQKVIKFSYDLSNRWKGRERERGSILKNFACSLAMTLISFCPELFIAIYEIDLKFFWFYSSSLRNAFYLITFDWKFRERKHEFRYNLIKFDDIW